MPSPSTLREAIIDELFGAFSDSGVGLTCSQLCGRLGDAAAVANTLDDLHAAGTIKEAGIGAGGERVWDVVARG